MATDILIIGLRFVGASLGLAIAQSEWDAKLTGYDPNGGAARQARKIGAVSRLVFRTDSAAARADMILLCSPADSVRQHLESLVPQLKPEAVVIDTSPLKGDIVRLAGELLVERRAYVGAIPILSPKQLYTAGSGDPPPEPDAFRGGLMAMVVPPQTRESAVDLALVLAHVIGASPFFIDPVEVDVVNAVADGLPAMLGAALMKVAVGTPSWHEIRRMAGRQFAQATAAAAPFDPGALANQLHLNRHLLLLKLDALLVELQCLRQALIEESPEGLQASLSESAEHIRHWQEARQRSDWAAEELGGRPDIPDVTLLDRLMGFKPFKGKSQR
jgi:prephenate dehydrogenase